MLYQLSYRPCCKSGNPIVARAQRQREFSKLDVEYQPMTDDEKQQNANRFYALNDTVETLTDAELEEYGH